MQFHAGYLIEGVWDALFISLNSKQQISNLRGLMRSLSCFEVEVGGIEADGPILEDSILKDASNAVSRGLPTRPSLRVEQAFSEFFGLTERGEDATGALSY